MEPNTRFIRLEMYLYSKRVRTLSSIRSSLDYTDTIILAKTTLSSLRPCSIDFSEFVTEKLSRCLFSFSIPDQNASK